MQTNNEGNQSVNQNETSAPQASTVPETVNISAPQNIANSSPMVSPAPPPVENAFVSPTDRAERSSEKQGSSGPSKLFYMILLLTIFVFAGLVAAVVFSMRQSSVNVPEKRVMVTPAITSQAVSNENQVDPVTASLQAQGTSDEVTDIDKDLNNTNLNSLDNEVSSIEASLP